MAIEFLGAKIAPASCGFCVSNDFKLLFEGRDYLYFSPESFRLVKCRKCGLVSTYPIPCPEETKLYYQQKSGAMPRDYFLFLNVNRIALIKKIRHSGRIFDIGCGNADFLSGMVKEGWEVYGNDPYRSLTRNNSGLKNIYNADLLRLDIPVNSFDIITLWHSLEHISQPFETLKKAAGLLKDDGTLIIEAPDFSSAQRKIFGERWQALEIPRHIYHFTLPVLKKMLACAGFEVYKRDYIVNPRVDFICLKMSILRWLGAARHPDRDGIAEPKAIMALRGRTLLWKAARNVFDIWCIILMFFFVALNQGSSFRIYCRKIRKNPYDGD